MQAIRTTNAKADIEREGKKYGNQQGISFIFCVNYAKMTTSLYYAPLFLL